MVISVRPLELDLDVNAGRHVEPHERVNGLWRRVDDVDQPLVRAHLEVLTRVLVLVRRPDHAIDVLLRRQRHRTDDFRPGPHYRIHDLPRRSIDDLVVITLQPNADLLSGHLPLPSASPLEVLLVVVHLRLRLPAPAVHGGAGSSRPSGVRYLLILVTRPAPTVRPPSRIANRRPSSIAIGWISSTFISVLSPGSTISVPSGRATTPVTSVVRK